MTPMREIKLMVIEFETTLGALYSFPDVNLDDIEAMLKHFNHEQQVTLVNVSRACMVIPSRVVKTIRVGGVERWTK